MTLRDAVFVAWVAVVAATLLTWGIFYVLHQWGRDDDE